ncbi:P-loop containing nucleoside triphosphate hydrolase protein [Podospora fimiseda]|uniref:P-loop containing nucleoside triphosphate hydrolase protein n=1 Tax=Podospora fimiseda TaxID=252190 RepID=A0AAN7BT18_9PEZI|nr:P-loop containing nucleoside triphosphate hydrolase protein [Podospora fimiseda]
MALGRPNVPLQMVGGRPQPGSEFRSRPATPSMVEFASPATPRSLLRVKRSSMPLPPVEEYSPLPWSPPVREYTPMPWTPPAPPPDDRPPVVYSRHIKVPRAREARIYMSPGVGFSELSRLASRARLPVAASNSNLNGRLYGQPVEVRPGRIDYKTTSRMEDWLSDLEALSLEPKVPVPLDATSSVGGEAGSSRADDNDGNLPGENRRVGFKGEIEGRRNNKRTAPMDIDQLMSEYDQPRTKRARLAESINSMFKRTTTAMSRAGSRLSRGDTLDVFTMRANTPFSLVSRANAQPERRRIKICLLGDSGAGKTAFLNRLIYGNFSPTEPSAATDYRMLNTWFGKTKEVVNVELWEFPGDMLPSQRNVHMMSTFFNAAILCYSIEKVENVDSLSKVWKFVLDVSLHDRPVFVLGLKKDLRPKFPGLGLSFLPSTETITAQKGCDAATAISANGFGECSAKTGENCLEAWEGITDFVLSALIDTEKGLSKNRGQVNREHVKDSAKETVRGAGRAVNKAFSWVPKLGKKMKDTKDQEKQKRGSAGSLATIAARNRMSR